ncbi:MAG: hypothetical protein J5529_09235 [Prevotella sp.]|jgi:hypothetical protein|nr:hypothetical protein [Prevotella sp.]
MRKYIQPNTKILQSPELMQSLPIVASGGDSGQLANQVTYEFDDVVDDLFGKPSRDK